MRLKSIYLNNEAINIKDFYFSFPEDNNKICILDIEKKEALELRYVVQYLKKIFLNYTILSGEDETDGKLIITFYSIGVTSYTVEWNEHGITKESIKINDKLVIERDLNKEEGIPVFGPEWQDEEEIDYMLTYLYPLAESGNLDPFDMYLYRNVLTFYNNRSGAVFDVLGKSAIEDCLVYFSMEEIERKLIHSGTIFSATSLYQCLSHEYLPGFTNAFPDLNRMIAFLDRNMKLFGFDFYQLTETEVYLNENGSRIPVSGMGSGFQQLFCTLPILYTMLLMGGTLFLEKFDYSLHPLVKNFLLRSLLKAKNNGGSLVLFSNYNYEL